MAHWTLPVAAPSFLFTREACAVRDIKCSTTGICHFTSVKNCILTGVGAFRACNKCKKWRNRSKSCRSHRKTNSDSEVRPRGGRKKPLPFQELTYVVSFCPTVRLIYFKILNFRVPVRPFNGDTRCYAPRFAGSEVARAVRVMSVLFSSWSFSLVMHFRCFTRFALEQYKNAGVIPRC